MVKIKLIARESLTDGRVSVSLEPLISRGTDKEQKGGTYLLLKIGQMLEDLEDEVNSTEYYKGSKQEAEDLEILRKIGG